MVFRRAFFISVALLLAGQAHAAPFFLKTSGLTARSAAPLDSISTFGRRIPSEIAVRAPDGIVVPFSKREEEELLRRQDNSTSSTGNSTVTVDNSPPPSVPTGNLNQINPQDIPEEVPATSPDGIIKAYSKREGRLFGRQNNSTSSTGNSTVTVDNSPPPSVPTGNLNQINPQDIPEEVPATSPDGVIKAYSKREGRLFGRQDNSTTTVTVDNSSPPPVPSGNENSLNPQDISDNDATSAVNGIITPYDKRGKARRFISPEIPTRSLNGEIELF
jgi:hypothetical protein